MSADDIVEVLQNFANAGEGGRLARDGSATSTPPVPQIGQNIQCR